MKASRLLIHEDQCPDKHLNILKTCPYNPVHKLPLGSYVKHKKECPQRPQVDEDLEKELREYLNQKGAKKFSNTTSSIPINEATVNNSNVTEKELLNFSRVNSKKLNSSEKIIGLQTNNKASKKERKERQKEMMNLIDNSDLDRSNYDRSIYESKTPQVFNADAIDFFYETEFGEIKIDEDNDYITDLQHSKISRNNQSEFIGNEISGINDYDPNESDLYIDNFNKNMISKSKNLDPRLQEYSCNISLQKNITGI